MNGAANCPTGEFCFGGACAPGCLAGGTVYALGANCGVGEVCSGEPANCVAGCYIDGAFYSPNATTNNGCEICSPTSSTSSWTNVDGAASCPADEVCIGGSCEPGCLISGTAYASGATSTSGCEVCTPASSSSAWTNATDGTSCGANDAECVGGICIGITTCVVGSEPRSVTFDGTNVWVANYKSLYVTKLLASTGATVGTYPVGGDPCGLAFDGTNIWVANQVSSTVTELLAGTGATVGTYAVGPAPRSVAFDGTNIWVANYGSNNVTQLLASTGATLGTYTVGTDPVGVAFDGSNIWVANSESNTVSKLPDY